MIDCSLKDVGVHYLEPAQRIRQGETPPVSVLQESKRAVHFPVEMVGKINIIQNEFRTLNLDVLFPASMNYVERIFFRINDKQQNVMLKITPCSSVWRYFRSDFNIFVPEMNHKYSGLITPAHVWASPLRSLLHWVIRCWGCGWNADRSSASSSQHVESFRAQLRIQSQRTSSPQAKWFIMLISLSCWWEFHLKPQLQITKSVLNSRLHQYMNSSAHLPISTINIWTGNTTLFVPQWL